MCELCNSEEEKYNYNLNNGFSIGICESCGWILFNKNIGSECNEMREQLVEMIEFIKFYKEINDFEVQEDKTLKLTS